MRILFVTPYVPSLIRPRPLNFVKQLSRSHEVTLVCLGVADPGELDALAKMKGCCETVLAIRHSKAWAMASCGYSLLTATPMQAAYTHCRSWNDTIAQLARDGHFDVVHVEHIRGAHLTEGIRHLPRIYDSVDCITRLLKQRVGSSQSLIQQLVNREELLKMRRYEPRVAGSFSSVVITSEHDRRALLSLMNRTPGVGSHRPDVTVIRNGVDSDYFSPDGASRPEPNTIVFSGKMSYFPNVSAVLRFYKEVFPAIRQTHRDARFKIVGSDPPPAVRALASDPAVEVTGYVPDIRPHLGSAAVITCPLTTGVGIQNKVLESMAMGKPVVTSSLVCRGIPDARNGHHLICADKPEDMTREIVRLLDNPQCGIDMGTRARHLVRTEYSWEASARTLVDVYAEALGRRRDFISTAA